MNMLLPRSLGGFAMRPDHARESRRSNADWREIARIARAESTMDRTRRRNRRAQGPWPRPLPPLAIVLGSGLGAFADEARDAIALPDLDLPGFPIPDRRGPRRAAGGRARSKAGGWRCSRAAATITSAAMRARCASRSTCFRKLGGEALFLTNAAGGLHADWRAALPRGDHRSYQLLRSRPADRPIGRRPLRAADRGL